MDKKLKKFLIPIFEIILDYDIKDISFEKEFNYMEIKEKNRGTFFIHRETLIKELNKKIIAVDDFVRGLIMKVMHKFQDATYYYIKKSFTEHIIYVDLWDSIEKEKISSIRNMVHKEIENIFYNFFPTHLIDIYVVDSELRKYIDFNKEKIKKDSLFIINKK